MDGSFDQAPNRAFRPLAGIIDGANHSRRQIAITAPVTQPAGRAGKIAMTAPVVQQPAGRPSSYLVQVVMPSGFTAQTLPVPEDARVRTREIPQQLAAAVRFSGRWTRRGSRNAGGAPPGRRRGRPPPGRSGALCPLHPPWTPWFLRRNKAVNPRGVTAR